MKHVVLFGKVFYITAPSFGDKRVNNIVKEFYWLVGIHDTPIFGGLENVVIDKHVAGEIYRITLNLLLLFIVYLLGFTWWLPIAIGILLGSILYADLKSFCSTAKDIVARHRERIAYAKLSWREKIEKDKESAKFYEEAEKLFKQMADEEKSQKD